VSRSDISVEIEVIDAMRGFAVIAPHNICIRAKLAKLVVQNWWRLFRKKPAQ